MQYCQPTNRTPPQLALFEGLIAHHLVPFADSAHKRLPAPVDRLSEMTLSGSHGHCRLLLAPILRELSEAADTRWLTLIAPPAAISQSWLRKSGFNRDRILLLAADDNRSALNLACKALASGCSHTVITWLPRLDKVSRARLRNAGEQGGAQSLNIRLA